MIVDPKNPFDVAKAWDFFKSLIKGESLFELKRIFPTRSNQQNRYLHLILGYFASEYGCSLDEAKLDYYKRTCNKETFEREHQNKKGATIKYIRSSKELTTKEMNLTIERFRNWSASVAEIYLPSPNEEQFLAHCRKVIEQNEEFI